MEKKILITEGAEETFRFAKEMGRDAKPGTVIALTGDLGAGKTVFARGFASGLGIDEPVTSPTFTILHIYEGGRLPLAHFDVYRIEEPEEMDEIGYEDWFFGDGAVLVEWADLIRELMPPETVWIRISRRPDLGDDTREIELS